MSLRSRPRIRGAQLPTPAQMAADERVPWQRLTVRIAEGNYKTSTGQWYRVRHRHEVRVVVVRVLTGGIAYRLSFSTDVAITAEQVIRAYALRWPIEVTFRASSSTSASPTRPATRGTPSSVQHPGSASSSPSQSSGTPSTATAPSSTGPCSAPGTATAKAPHFTTYSPRQGEPPPYQRLLIQPHWSVSTARLALTTNSMLGRAATRPSRRGGPPDQLGEHSETRVRAVGRRSIERPNGLPDVLYWCRVPLSCVVWCQLWTPNSGPQLPVEPS